MQINSVNSDTFSFLNEHYNVIYQSEGLQSAEEATTFFLQEPTEEKLKINCQFIDTLAKTAAIFVPCYRHNESVQSDVCRYTYMLKDEREIYGWDFGTYPELLEADAKIITAHVILRTMEGLAYKKARKAGTDLSSYLNQNQDFSNTLQIIASQIFSSLNPDPSILASFDSKRMGSLANKIHMTEELNKRCFIVPKIFLDENEYDKSKIQNSTAQENLPQLLKEQLKNKKAVILAFKS